MRVAILYNEPVASRYDAFGEGEAIRGVLDSVQGVKDALTAQGHDVTLHGLIPPIADCVGAIHQIEADVIFNLFEGFDGRPETEAQIALELEAVGIPFTGASSGILALCQNKARTKKLLMSLGIATADYQLLSEANLDSFNLEFPVIVKPAAEDASHGLSQKSVVNDIESLEQQVIEMERGYGGPVLVERFISGREFNLSISGGETPRPLSISEIVYSSDMPGPKILTFDAK
jgi:D-alanine-D-alanine ligase